ncbi:MAG TPA: hypothetical protein PLC42_06425 [Parachlamydiaceae bacterium]|nr:hypothetical protein [Parachlamydiaceae bacterium]
MTNCCPSTGTADPFHLKMLQLGAPNPLYTRTDAQVLDAEAEAHFLVT